MMRIVLPVFGMLGALMIGLWGFALYRNNHQPAAADAASCQKLIDQALVFTGNVCNRIGANKACYGNVTIQAQMAPRATQRFSRRGDVADVSEIQSISAAPLNPQTEEWGIAIFKVPANVPGSVPGETATLMVFGNTELDRKSEGMESFYFSSELGQIMCDKVPFDGILINMPDGAGWKFEVNGTDLTLRGTPA